MVSNEYISFIIYFCGAGDQTQGLVLANEVLCHLSQPFLFYFVN
jgi:hypothetical protein